MTPHLRLRTSRSPFIRGGVTVNRLGVELDAGTVTAPQLLAILLDDNITVAQRSDPSEAFVTLAGEERESFIVAVQEAIGVIDEIAAAASEPTEQVAGSTGGAASAADPDTGAAGDQSTPAAPASQSSAEPAAVIPAAKAPAPKPSGRKPKN